MKIGFLTDSKLIPLWVSDLIGEVSQISGVQVNFVASLNIGPQDQFGWLANKIVQFDRSIWPDKKNLFVSVSPEPTQYFFDLHAVTVDGQIILNAEDSSKLTSLGAELIIYTGQSSVVLSKPHELNGLLWTISYADSPDIKVLMPGYQEWYHNCDANFIGIRQFNPDKSSKLIASRLIRALHFSYNRNLSSVVTATAELIRLSIEKLISGHQLPVVNPATVSATTRLSADRVPLRLPTRAALMFGFVKLFLRAAIRFVEGRFYHAEAWGLFFKSAATKSPWTDLHHFTPLLPSKDKIWADPFVISNSEGNYVFLEEMNYGGKGRIICLHLSAVGEVLNSQIILEKPFHLSYPFLIQQDGVWYMIPESSENNTVDLYECVQFPYQWKFRKNILSGIKALDSTIFRHREKFWLFCSVQQHECGSPNDALHIYYTDDFLNGTWKPHRHNPVMLDACNARPAGNFFMHEGAIYRPSQICIPDYGMNMGLNRVLELSEDTYSEERVTTLSMSEHGIYKIHTFNFNENFRIVDGALRRFKY